VLKSADSAKEIPAGMLVTLLLGTAQNSVRRQSIGNLFMSETDNSRARTLGQAKNPNKIDSVNSGLVLDLACTDCNDQVEAAWKAVKP
jgi:hypothetical protein